MMQKFQQLLIPMNDSVLTPEAPTLVDISLFFKNTHTHSGVSPPILVHKKKNTDMGRGGGKNHKQMIYNNSLKKT